MLPCDCREMSGWPGSASTPSISESIHNHSAFARVEWTRPDPVPIKTSASGGTLECSVR